MKQRDFVPHNRMLYTRKLQPNDFTVDLLLTKKIVNDLRETHTCIQGKVIKKIQKHKEIMPTATTTTVCKCPLSVQLLLEGLLESVVPELSMNLQFHFQEG